MQAKQSIAKTCSKSTTYRQPQRIPSVLLHLRNTAHDKIHAQATWSAFRGSCASVGQKLRRPDLRAGRLTDDSMKKITPVTRAKMRCEARGGESHEDVLPFARLKTGKCPGERQVRPPSVVMTIRHCLHDYGVVMEGAICPAAWRQ